MSTIRFFHIADVHLDSPFKGIYGLSEQALRQLRNSTFQAFEQIIQYALERKPDFILLVGDIYDGENRSLKAQKYFQEGMERLGEEGIPVILSHGNHDHLNGRWTRFALPNNVYVLPEQTSKVELVIRGQQVNIYGFSYPDRHVKQPMIQTYPEAEDKAALHIGMLHGSVEGDSAHAVYAPFTKNELLTKGYDYWALGHIHKRQLLHENPSIVYPGNIQSRHRNEQGVKGFYEVQLTKEYAELTFLPTSAIVYTSLILNCEQLIHANELLKACADLLEEARQKLGAIVVDLTFAVKDTSSQILLESSSVKEWLEVIREMEEANTPFTWIQSLTIDDQVNEKYVPTAMTESVLAVLEEWDLLGWKEALKDLYQHTASSRFLEPLNAQQIEQLTEEAKQLFKQEMKVKL